jgi:hypothetical protein
MGLLPQVILGALLIVAFALSAQQRLHLNSGTGPMPARQLAYLMRQHHQGAIALKQATPSLQAVIDAPPPTMNINDFVFLSCIGQKSVATFLMTITQNGGYGLAVIPRLMISTTEANAVVEELRRQTVMAPELGRTGQSPWATGYNGSPAPLIAPSSSVGFADDLNLPAGCMSASGVPTIITQVLP